MLQFELKYAVFNIFLYFDLQRTWYLFKQ